MRPLRRIPGLASALLVSAACSSHRGPSIPLLLGEKADPVTRCAVSSGSQEDHLPGVDKVRVTLRSHASDGSTLDFCDRVFDSRGTPPNLKLSLGGADKVDIFVEAFSAQSGDMSSSGVQRLATGTIPGVSPSTASLGALHLYPTEDFRCAPAQMQFGRAFHTATLLPDGRVLFIGGLVASVTDATMSTFAATGATATDQAEIWDPRTQAVTPVNAASASGDMGTTADLATSSDLGGGDGGAPPISSRPGRAFHSAALLSTNGPCAANELAILVVGGFSPMTVGAPIFGGQNGLSGSRLQPFGGSSNNQLFVHAASNEVFCFDPAANTASHVPITGTAAGFRASTVGPDGFLIAGGIDYDSTAYNTITYPTGNLDVFPIGGGTLVSGDTADHHMGATVTMLPDGQALLWGGGEYGDPIGELLGDLKAAPYGAPIEVAGATATQFQTATLLAQATPPSVLVTGGFEVVQGGVDTQPPIAGNAVRVLAVQGGVVTPSTPPFGANPTTGTTYPGVVSCSDPTRYRPAGYESAIPLDRGRVLVTGGTPSTTSATSHCPDCPAGVPSTLPLCALGQASLYEGGQLVPAAAMQVARFGHTSTMLKDGTILVAGGIGQSTAPGAAVGTVFIDDLEIYNPRTVTPPYDASMMGSVDTDDPIADVLSADKLTRAPGEQAVDPAHPATPAKSCGTL